MIGCFFCGQETVLDPKSRDEVWVCLECGTRAKEGESPKAVARRRIIELWEEKEQALKACDLDRLADSLVKLAVVLQKNPKFALGVMSELEGPLNPGGGLPQKAMKRDYFFQSWLEQAEKSAEGQDG